MFYGELNTENIVTHAGLFLVCCIALGVGCFSETSEVAELKLIRVDSIQTTSSVLIADVYSAAYSQGSYWIVDPIQSNLISFSHTIEDSITLKVFALSGSGPGQCYSPEEVLALPCGTIGVNSFYEGKIIFFNRWGEYTQETVFGGASPIHLRALSDTTYLGKTFIHTPPYGGTRLSVWNTDGTMEREVHSRITDYDEYGNYQSATNIIYTASTNGIIYYANSCNNEFEIFMVDANGEQQSFFRQDWEPLMKSEERLDYERSIALNDWVQCTGSSEGFSYEPQVELPSITYLGVDADQNIWVRTPIGASPYFIVLDDSGQHIFNCSFSPPSYQECSGWSIIFSNTKILAIPRNAAIEPKVYILEVADAET